MSSKSILSDFSWLFLIVLFGAFTWSAAAVSPNGTPSFIINAQNHPTLTLTRGVTYVFVLSGTSIRPFWIKTDLTIGSGGGWPIARARAICFQRVPPAWPATRAAFPPPMHTVRRSSGDRL